ncbi:heme biosynthesis operon protein HemX [Cellvibrio zantedeschiae]|uniref:Heme biosynthesis operon protein HemX n=1 Tax=Cellvibrio zantedeschiae TaxID=1237077 RepID=A0ABQ3BAX3_9GAMM|nr:uroporphyrinogen-III C-methyltransferase [Cellvibrio zantedeschiae]GGY82059.1 heme biosynthesis operon protein HemX [Cellvibrio zantedeschiae]
MSDLNTSAQADEVQAATKTTLRPVRSRLGQWIMLVLLALVAGVSVFLWYQHQAIKKLNSELLEQTQAIEIKRKALEAKVAEDLAAQDKQVQGDVTELTQRLDSTTSKVLALTNMSHDDWKLAEVDFLLRMANQRILMEHEATNSLALAQSANSVLAEMQNADLFPARKKLTEEIEALKLASKVDREGIYLQLLAITQQIENIPLIEPLFEEDEEAIAAMEQGEEPTSTTLWQRVKNMGKHVWHKLSIYVRVRDQGRRVDAILPPEDQMYLKQNLRLMLEQAQIGLLREEQHVYQASLDKAQSWIRDYYPLNDQAQIVLNDLDQLKKNNVQQPLPDFSGSAALVKEYLRQKDRLAFSRHGGN